MKILISRISGFLGNRFCKYAKNCGNNYTIYGLDYVSQSDDMIIRTFLKTELLNPEISNMDAIIHLSGETQNTQNDSSNKDLLNFNNGLSKWIFDFFLSSKIKTFIFIRTAKPSYKNINIMINGGVLPKPHGIYGESENDAEEYILKIKFCTCLKRVFILRPCIASIEDRAKTHTYNMLDNLYSILTSGKSSNTNVFSDKDTDLLIKRICSSVNDCLVENTKPSGIYNISYRKSDDFE